MTNKNNAMTAFFNGEYMPIDQVAISPFDRGFLLGDSIYEAIPAYAGNMLDSKKHFQRLMDGLAAVGIESSYTLAQWSVIAAPVLQDNEPTQLLYIQVTRGAQESRNHRFPIDCSPTVLMFPVIFIPSIDSEYLGCPAHLQQDLRWQRCDIKSTSLMGNVLAYRQLYNEGVNQHEALLVRDGLVVEAPSSNLFMAKDGVIYTPPVDNILPGVTRALVIELAQKLEIPVIEKSPNILTLKNADEVWVTNSMEELKPIISIDSDEIGNGVPGPIWKLLFTHFQALKN